MTSKYFLHTKSTDMEQTTRKRNASFKDDKKGTSNIKLRKKPTDDSSDCCVSVQSQPCIKSPVQESCTTLVSSSLLGQTFYDVPCVVLARRLLGQHVVRSIGTQSIRGRIVETEAYQGPEDKAAHSYQGKKTPRNEAMFMKPGTSYVYNIYGMYCCMNISSQGDGAAVLIRALEPIEGQDLMEKGRRNNSDKNKRPLKEKDLSNGPSKLCQALHISKNDFDKVDLTLSDSLWLESSDQVDDSNVVSCPRINIGYADDWKEKPLRFYILGNSSVSVKDKKAELQLKSDTKSE